MFGRSWPKFGQLWEDTAQTQPKPSTFGRIWAESGLREHLLDNCSPVAAETKTILRSRF